MNMISNLTSLQLAESQLAEWSVIIITDLTSARRLAVECMNNYLNKEFSGVIFVLYLHSLPKLNAWGNRTLWKTSSIAEEAFPVQNKNLSIYLSIYLSNMWPHDKAAHLRIAACGQVQGFSESLQHASARRWSAQLCLIIKWLWTKCYLLHSHIIR